MFVLDNLSSGKEANINQNAKFIKADVLDKNVFEIIEKEKIAGVYHLAAQPIVDIAYQEPLKAIETNIMGTANLLEACRLKGDINFVVVASSDKAYGWAKELPYQEDFPLKGSHPYDASKSAADLISRAYFLTYGLPVAVTRFSNVFGPRDHSFSRIIPGALKALINNQALAIRSDGQMIREYIYVSDVVQGCVKLASSIMQTGGQAFNFGSTNIFSVVEVINKIEEILGQEIKYKILNISKNEIPQQYLDWSKAKKELAWQPRTSFKEGIIRSFAWYQEYFKNKFVFRSHKILGSNQALLIYMRIMKLFIFLKY